VCVLTDVCVSEMAFARSQRFVDTATCAPPPTAYQLPSAFDEISCSPWAVCGDQCQQCYNNYISNEHIQESKAHEAPNEKSPLCVHSHNKENIGASLCSPENKENACCVQKKDVSRFTKNSKLTEPKAPSFMARRSTIHNCLTNNTEEKETPKSNFNRHSLKRKSMKIIKENKEKTSEKLDSSLSPTKSSHMSNLQSNKHLNVSYTVIGKKSSEENISSCPVAANINKGAIPKIPRNVTDDMKKNESINKLDFSSTEDNIALLTDSNLEVSSEKVLLEKDDDLQKDPVEPIRNVKIDMENAVKGSSESVDSETYSKSSNSLNEIESHVVFLVADQFIDDEFDSYVEGVTLKKKNANEEDSNITKICNSLVQLHMEKLSVQVPKKKILLKRSKSGVKKGRQNVYKYLAKKQNSTRSTNIVLGSEVEKTVRIAVNKLKEEFKNEVYRRTEEKIDALMSKLAAVLLKADESINNKCENAASELINKLEKLID